MKYYSLKPILTKGVNCKYFVIFGERSNGKTFSVLEYAVKNYIDTGEQLALIRRWREDFVGKRGSVMFDALVDAGTIKKLSKGKWTNVFYQSSKWYLCRYEDDERITDDRPFAYGFAVSEVEHDKSTSYPRVTTILFDEFIARSYIPDEFSLFCNTLSTIIRQRDNVKIFMCGNSINRYNPYFKEMYLSKAGTMKQGTIDIYEYSNGLRVAVEYCSPLNKDGKKSDVYFAFDNPKLSMITSGAWELPLYPRCPIKYRPCDILFTYFILFEGNILQCEIVSCETTFFTMIHKKTTELKNPNKDLVYSLEPDPRYNWAVNITRPTNKVTQKVAQHFKEDKIFFDSNETGDILRNYLKSCGK